MASRRRKPEKPALKGKARVRAEISEIAQDLANNGMMSREEANKITMRMIGPDGLPGVTKMAPAGIVSVREREHMSQAVFARLLGVTTSTLSKWERGEVQPRGPAQRLLRVIEVHGSDALLKLARS